MYCETNVTTPSKIDHLAARLEIGIISLLKSSYLSVRVHIFIITIGLTVKKLCFTRAIDSLNFFFRNRRFN